MKILLDDFVINSLSRFFNDRQKTSFTIRSSDEKSFERNASSNLKIMTPQKDTRILFWWVDFDTCSWQIKHLRDYIYLDTIRTDRNLSAAIFRIDGDIDVDIRLISQYITINDKSMFDDVLCACECFLLGRIVDPGIDWACKDGKFKTRRR